MTRLSFLIFLLLFIALGYVGYLAHLNLDQNQKNKEALQMIALKVAGESIDAEPVSKPTPGIAPAVIAAPSQWEPYLNSEWDRVNQLSKLGLLKRHDKLATSMLINAKKKLDNKTEWLDAMVLIREAEFILRGKAPAQKAKGVMKDRKLPGTKRKVSQINVSKNPVKQASAGSQYRVKKGDNLWEISKRLYRTPWRWHDIWTMNREKLPNYRRMPVGMKLRLPG